MVDPVEQAIQRTLSHIVEALDVLEREDLDIEHADGKVEIVHSGGTRFIVNRQSATGQIWLAEPRGGWRFDRVDGRWIDGKRGVELHAELSRLLSAQVGEPIVLTPA